MANNYFDMTGVLVLDKVTPVIRALFNDFELDTEYPSKGHAYIANISESTSCSWDSVVENLQELAENLNVTVQLEDGSSCTMEDVLVALAKHFNAETNEELAGLIERHPFEDEADLDTLFSIAKAFDDGHGLKAMKTESAWHCSKPRLFEFGGCGSFVGTHVTVSGDSSSVIELGEKVEAALTEGDTDKAAETIRAQVGHILAGIYNENDRNKVKETLSALLSL